MNGRQSLNRNCCSGEWDLLSILVRDNTQLRPTYLIRWKIKKEFKIWRLLVLSNTLEWIICKSSVHIISQREPIKVFWASLISSSQGSPKPCCEVSPTADSFYPAKGWGSFWHSRVTKVLDLRYCHVLKTYETERSGQARNVSHSAVQLSYYASRSGERSSCSSGNSQDFLIDGEWC